MLHRHEWPEVLAKGDSVYLRLLDERKVGQLIICICFADQSFVFRPNNDVVKLIKYIVLFTLIIEGIGAYFLALAFIPRYGTEGVLLAIWHAISAFSNAAPLDESKTACKPKGCKISFAICSSVKLR